MKSSLNYFPPGTIGDFTLGAPLDSIPAEMTRLELRPSKYHRDEGIQPYEIRPDGWELVQLDVEHGLISGVTTYTSFVVNERELIGNDLALLELAINEVAGEETIVAHGDGSIVSYCDFPTHGMIVAAEGNKVESVFIFSEDDEEDGLH